MLTAILIEPWHYPKDALTIAHEFVCAPATANEEARSQLIEALAGTYDYAALDIHGFFCTLEEVHSIF